MSTAIGPYPLNTTCPSCHATIRTKLNYAASTKTHVIAILLCGLCCCCLPYILKSCRNAEHFCPMCRTFIGSYTA